MKKQKFEFLSAPEIKKAIDEIIDNLDLGHLDKRQIFCVRSQGSKARAYARIWGLSRIFQITAGYKPTYVIEVLSKHFDKLNDKEKIKVLIHELLHIPKTFSGALKSHRGPHHRINDREVEKIYQQLKK